jgi:hypothetical protein
MILGRKHGMQGRPNSLSSSILSHLAQHIITHRCNEGAKNKLVLSILANIVRIWNLTRSIIRALGDLLGRRRDGAIHIPEELMRAKNRGSLGLPEEEVILRQSNDDRVPKRMNGDDS